MLTRRSLDGQTHLPLPRHEPRDRLHALDHPQPARRRAATSAPTGASTSRSWPSSASSGAWAAPFISLQLSRWTAKRAMGVQLVNGQTGNPGPRLALQHRRPADPPGQPADARGRRLRLARGQRLRHRARARRRSLVAVLHRPAAQHDAAKKSQGVLAHEISHVANGDMVTMTLLQGVVNAFVMFLAAHRRRTSIRQAMDSRAARHASRSW